MTTPFLFWTLLFPRLSLLICWTMGTMPLNPTSWWVDVLGAIFAPRWLLAWWCWCAGYHGWALAYLVLSLLVTGPIRGSRDKTGSSRGSRDKSTSPPSSSTATFTLP